MKRLLPLILALVALPALCATVTFPLTNFNLTVPTNTIQLFQYNGPYASSSALVTGPPIRLYPSNGFAQTNLLGGTYELKLVGIAFPKQVYFIVPDDTNTYAVMELMATNITQVSAHAPYMTLRDTRAAALADVTVTNLAAVGSLKIPLVVATTSELMYPLGRRIGDTTLYFSQAFGFDDQKIYFSSPSNYFAGSVYAPVARIDSATLGGVTRTNWPADTDVNDTLYDSIGSASASANAVSNSLVAQLATKQHGSANLTNWSSIAPTDKSDVSALGTAAYSNSTAFLLLHGKADSAGKADAATTATNLANGGQLGTSTITASGSANLDLLTWNFGDLNLWLSNAPNTALRVNSAIYAPNFYGALSGTNLDSGTVSTNKWDATALAFVNGKQPASANLTNWSAIMPTSKADVVALGSAAYSNSLAFQPYSLNLLAWSGVETNAKQDRSANLDGWSAIAATNTPLKGTVTVSSDVNTNSMLTIDHGSIYLPRSDASDASPTHAEGIVFSKDGHASTGDTSNAVGRVLFQHNWGGTQSNGWLLLAAQNIRLEPGWWSSTGSDNTNSGTVSLGNEDGWGDVIVNYTPLATNYAGTGPARYGERGQPYETGWGYPLKFAVHGCNATGYNYYAYPGIQARGVGQGDPAVLAYDAKHDWCALGELWFYSATPSTCGDPLNLYDAYPGVPTAKMHTNSWEFLNDVQVNGGITLGGVRRTNWPSDIIGDALTNGDLRAVQFSGPVTSTNGFAIPTPAGPNVTFTAIEASKVYINGNLSMPSVTAGNFTATNSIILGNVARTNWPGSDFGTNAVTAASLVATGPGVSEASELQLTNGVRYPITYSLSALSNGTNFVVDFSKPVTRITMATNMFFLYSTNVPGDGWYKEKVFYLKGSASNYTIAFSTDFTNRHGSWTTNLIPIGPSNGWWVLAFSIAGTNTTEAVGLSKPNY